MNIENFSLKGIIQNYVGCFLVYLFMDLYFLKKRKKGLQDEGFKFCMGSAPDVSNTHFKFEFQCSVILKIEKPLILMFSVSTSV